MLLACAARLLACAVRPRVWPWLGRVLEAGAVFADFDVEAGAGLTGAGDGLPGAAVVGAEFGFPLNSEGDGVVDGLAIVEITGGIGERGAQMEFTNNERPVSLFT